VKKKNKKKEKKFQVEKAVPVKKIVSGSVQRVDPGKAKKKQQD